MTTASALLGTHLSAGCALATVPDRAHDMGARSVQIFLGNPRGWATSAGDPAAERRFRTAAERHRMTVLVHAAYLVNLGSPTPLTYQRSIESLTHAVWRGRAVTAAGVVVHTGSCVTGNRSAAMKQVREALLPLLDSLTDDDPDLLLEPTAGQGQSLCATVDDQGSYLNALECHPRARVCLDTCHAFAAGHDIARPNGMTDLLDQLERVIGPGRLGAVHANDSLDVRGSFRDRHQRIGQGHIGPAAFGELLRH